MIWFHSVSFPAPLEFVLKSDPKTSLFWCCLSLIITFFVVLFFTSLTVHLDGLLCVALAFTSSPNFESLESSGKTILIKFMRIPEAELFRSMYPKFELFFPNILGMDKPIPSFPPP